MYDWHFFESGQFCLDFPMTTVYRYGLGSGFDSHAWRLSYFNSTFGVMIQRDMHKLLLFLIY